MLRLALYQCGGADDKATNLANAAEVVAKAAATHRASSSAAVPLLLCFPELFLTGYNVGDVLHRDAEPVYGPSIKVMVELAKANGVHIVFGYPEKVVDNDQTTTTYYNSAIFISAEGEVLLNYRKTHLWGPYEKKYFTPGSSLAPVVKIGEVSVGLLICWDVEFPEPSRVLMLRGADLILVPTACMTSFAPEVTVRSRAFENKLFVAYVNRAGDENGSRFCGLSSVVTPNGYDDDEKTTRVLDAPLWHRDCACKAGGESGELLFTDIEPKRADYEESRDRDPIHLERRTELYRELTQ